MAACAVFSHPLSVDTRVQANAGLFLQRCATPQQLRTSPAVTLSREARSFPTLQNRSIVSSAVQEYLKSLNFMTRTIVLETETVEKEHRERWTHLDQSKREELVNEHFIPSEVRVQYTSGFVGGWQRMPRGTDVDNRPLHLSQPTGEEEWKSLLVEGHCSDPNRGEILVTNPDIYLSQPLDYSYEPASSTFTITSRLHKQQRSFRAAAFRTTTGRFPAQQQQGRRTTPSPPTFTVHPQRATPPPPSPSRRLTPCSSPLRIDDDRISLSAPDSEEGRSESPLGFQRNKLRSFSMRPKRGDSSRDKTQPAHKSFRGLTTRIKKEVTAKTAEPESDDKIDLPDERLMRDHVTPSNTLRPAAFSRQKPERYSKKRQVKRTAEAEPQAVTPLEPVYKMVVDAIIPIVTPPSPSKYAERSVDVTITPTSPTKSISGISIGSASTTISRALKSSQDNLDTISMTSLVSNRSLSHLLDDTRSEHSERLKVKTTEGASLRPMSKRCGSAYKTSTSDFADRKALFKPNMLKKHKGVSSVLSDSREATPTPELHMNLPIISLTQAPSPFLTMAKHDSLVESVTTDLPSSPDHMSPVSSPPDTPLTRSPVKCKRESGYMSSSFEVLEDDTLLEKVSLADDSDHHMCHADINLTLNAMDVR